MRYSFLFSMVFVLCLAHVLGVYAMTATTEDGKQVILNTDGTWKYAPADKKSTAEMGEEWKKPDSATSVLKGKAGFYEVWYDPDKWTPDPSPHNPIVEYSLVSSSKDGQATIIAERTAMPLETLKRAAIENAKKAAPDLKVIDEQHIKVNGAPVLKMRMHGTIQGIAFAYLGLYWTGKAGALQVITYTSQNLEEEFRPEFEKLLSGLVITKP